MSNPPEPSPKPSKKKEAKPDSLSILNPAPLTPTTTDRETGTPTAQHIETLCRRVIDLLHTRDFSHPDFTTLIAPDFRAYLPHSVDPHITSRESYLNDYRAFTELNANYRVIISNIAAYVDEKQGLAEAWILFRVAGDPDALQRDNVTVAFWKRRGGEWVSLKQTGLRGAGGYW